MFSVVCQTDLKVCFEVASERDLTSLNFALIVSNPSYSEHKHFLYIRLHPCCLHEQTVQSDSLKQKPSLIYMTANMQSFHP